MPRSTVEEFPAGEDFQAYSAAEKWLKTRGFVTGSMQRGAPTGVHRASEALDISKWRGRTDLEKRGLDGTIESVNGSFRDGPVYIRMSRRGREFVARYEKSTSKESNDGI